MKKMSSGLDKLEKISRSEIKARQHTNFDSNEKKIIDITHTWKLVKDKVDKEV